MWCVPSDETVSEKYEEEEREGEDRKETISSSCPV
jgi:hypothetical protein